MMPAAQRFSNTCMKPNFTGRWKADIAMVLSMQHRDGDLKGQFVIFDRQL
jgi:hypothetical protein